MTSGSTGGFIGVTRLDPGEVMREHHHPDCEEFVLATRGELIVEIDGVPRTVGAGEGCFVPRNTRHQLRNPGDGPAELVVHLGPLIPTHHRRSGGR